MNEPISPEQREELRRLAEAVNADDFGHGSYDSYEFDVSGYRDAIVAALLDALDAGPRSEERLREKLREAEQAVRDHEAKPYPDVPDGGWIWSRDAAHLGGIVVGLRAALRTTEEASRE